MFLTGRRLAGSSLNRLLLLMAAYGYVSLWWGSYFMHLAWPTWITDYRVSDWKNYWVMPLMAILVMALFKTAREMKILIALMCVANLIVDRGFLLSMRGRDL